MINLVSRLSAYLSPYKERPNLNRILWVNPNPPPFNPLRFLIFSVYTAKVFYLTQRTHVENDDVNVSFNIVVRQVSVSRSIVDRDAAEGSTDTSKEVTSRTNDDLRTPQASAVGVCQTANLSSHD